MKGILVNRQRMALQRLEAAYAKFKAAGEDKKPWTSAGGHYHKGRKFAEECKRMQDEISSLKEKISRKIKI